MPFAHFFTNVDIQTMAKAMESSAAVNVHVATTLAMMQRVYQLSREGGPKSERFAAYVALSPTNYGLAQYNPMAGDAALETVQNLIALQAESLAQQAAARVARECGYEGPITLAIAVRSKGMWTDRVATEVDERVTGKARVLNHGVINMWSREEIAEDDIERESVAEAVRVMWHTTHGVADTLLRVLQCEGLAYALAPLSSHHALATPIGPEQEAVIVEALEIVGDSRFPGDIAAVLYGDDVAKEMGYTPLGLPPAVGYRWAVHQARLKLADSTPASVLRAEAS